MFSFRPIKKIATGQESWLLQNYKEVPMNLDRFVLAVAGSFILLSVILAMSHSPYWLFFTGFVGVNLLQSSFTGFCPMAVILKKIGVRTGHAFG